MSDSPGGRRDDDRTVEPSVAGEVDAEIRFHIDTRIDQLVAGGESPERARERALREFGSVEEARSEMERRTKRRRRRRVWARLASDALTDVRLAARAARRRPGSYLTAILSIAVGVASVSTVWTGIDRLVLRPLPYDLDGTLAFVGVAEGARGGTGWPLSPADFSALDATVETVALAAYQEGGANLGGEVPRWVSVRRVTPDFFDVVGVEPHIGRALRSSDLAAGRSLAVVLGHALWVESFGADPSVVGRTLRVDGRTVEVVGVVPEDFVFWRGATDLWMPLDVSALPDQEARTVIAIGRLQGDGLTATRAELATVATDLAAERPDTHSERTFPINTALAELRSGPTVAQGLTATLLAAVAVLLIACTNVANLLLARGLDNARNTALRRALGAGRGRILRQLLTDSAVLAFVGGLVGVTLSVWGVRGLRATVPPGIPRAHELGLDGWNVAAGMAVAGASVLVFGVVPAFRVLAAGERRLLSSARTPGTGGRGRLVRAALVGGQVGLAALLVATTTLVVQSFQSLAHADVGIEASNVWTARVTLPSGTYTDDVMVRDGTDRLSAVLAAVPGVVESAVSVGLPGAQWRWLAVALPGEEPTRDDRVIARVSDPKYADLLGLQPIRGRLIDEGDAAGGRRVAVVNELFADRWWGDSDPIGRTMLLEGQPVEVVGVVPDVRETGAGSPPRDAVYLPLAQWPSRSLALLFKSPLETPPVPAIRGAVAQVDGDIALTQVRELEEVLVQSAGTAVALSRVLGALAVIALLLAMGGVYAVASYDVAHRAREIGVRMALGANRWRVRRSVLRDSIRVCFAGLSVALPLAWMAGRGLTSFMFDPVGSAPTTFAVVAVVLMGICVCSAWVPARRASAVDPMQALRTE